MTRIPATALRRLGTLTAGLLLVAGLSHLPAYADGDVPPDPAAPTAKVGDCHDLTLKQVTAPNIAVAPVDCRSDHTSQVIAVASLPDALTWSSDQDQIGAAVNGVCWRALRKLVGTNLLRFARTQYSFVWFQPTDEQVAAGARWFTCHVVVPEDKRLADLPRSLPRLRATMPDTVARCLAPRTAAYTTCADRHGWRSTYAFYVHTKPTAKHAAAASARCRRHVKNFKTSMYSWVPVSNTKFVTVCYTKTSH